MKAILFRIHHDSRLRSEYSAAITHGCVSNADGFMVGEAHFGADLGTKSWGVGWCHGSHLVHQLLPSSASAVH